MPAESGADPMTTGYFRYHRGEASPLRQFLYDRVGMTDLARMERHEVDLVVRQMVTEALEAKAERSRIKCGLA